MARVDLYRSRGALNRLGLDLDLLIAPPSAACQMRLTKTTYKVICLDERSIEELAGSIASLGRQFQRDKDLSQG